MEERNKTKITNLNRQKLIFLALGSYSLFAIFITFLWLGELINLFLLLSAVAIFFYSLFKPLYGFFILLLFRTTFDYIGSEQELFNIFSISISFTFLLGTILISLALAEIIKHQNKAFKAAIFWPWLIFLAANIFLSFFSFDKQASLVNFFRLLSFFSAFVFGYFIFNTSAKLTNLARAIIFSAIIPASVAWWQLMNRTGFYDGTQWRLDGTFTHPNMLAIYLVLVISLTLFVALNLRKNAVERIPYALLVIFFSIPLLFTYTRVAWLALAFILFAVGVYRFRKLLLISIVSVALLYFFAPFFQDRVSTLSSIGTTDSSSWRLDLWRDIWGYIKTNPWFGYGPGTAAVFLGKNIPRLLTDTEPHNDYLRVWLESGIFVLLSYLWIFIDYLKRMVRGFKLENKPRLKMLIFFLIFFTISLGGASMTDNILKDAVMQWEFWALSGGVFAAINLTPDKNKKESL
jgi:O-antigen ligase